MSRQTFSHRAKFSRYPYVTTVVSCSRRFPIGLVLQVSACHDSNFVLKTFPIGLVVQVSVCYDSNVVLKTYSHRASSSGIRMS